MSFYFNGWICNYKVACFNLQNLPTIYLHPAAKRSFNYKYVMWFIGIKYHPVTLYTCSLLPQYLVKVAEIGFFS